MYLAKNRTNLKWVAIVREKNITYEFKILKNQVTNTHLYLGIKILKYLCSSINKISHNYKKDTSIDIFN